MHTYLRAFKLYPYPFIMQYAILSFSAPLTLLLPTLPIKEWPVMLYSLIPLILSYLYTFLLNNMKDVLEDSTKGTNPFSTGELSNEDGKRLLSITLFTFILSLIPLMFVSISSIIILLFAIIMGTAYSTGPRLKETIYGPVVASLFHWGPSVYFSVLALDLGSLVISSPIIIVFLAAIALGMYIELEHTLRDLPHDLTARRRTFPLIVGPRATERFMRIMATLYISLGMLFTLAFSQNIYIYAFWLIIAVIYIARPEVPQRVFSMPLYLAVVDTAHPTFLLTIISILLALPEIVFISIIIYYAFEGRLVALPYDIARVHGTLKSRGHGFMRRRFIERILKF